jgi:hypothetical protein
MRQIHLHKADKENSIKFRTPRSMWRRARQPQTMHACTEESPNVCPQTDYENKLPQLWRVVPTCATPEKIWWKYFCDTINKSENIQRKKMLNKKTNFCTIHVSGHFRWRQEQHKSRKKMWAPTHKMTKMIANWSECVDGNEWPGW